MPVRRFRRAQVPVGKPLVPGISELAAAWEEETLKAGEKATPKPALRTIGRLKIETPEAEVQSTQFTQVLADGGSSQGRTMAAFVCCIGGR